MNLKVKERVNNILLKKGLLTKEKAEQLTKQTLSENQTYLEYLVKNRVVAEQHLLAALALEFRLAPIDATKVLPEKQLLKAFNQDWAKSYNVLPLAKINKVITLAVAAPDDIIKLDNLKLLSGYEIKPVFALDFRIMEAIERLYTPKDYELLETSESTPMDEESPPTDGIILISPNQEQEDENTLRERAQDAPIINFVNMIIYKALGEGASDIHIEPFDKELVIRYRKDGVLHHAMSPPLRIYNAVLSRIKIMASLDIAEHRIPQDGKFQIRYQGRQIDFRVSILPTIFGEKIVMRILDASSINLGLDALGFEPQALEAFRRAINAPYGMILVTGPTGSGKSTTLYAALKEIMSTEDNILTVEDPVEYQLEGIAQVPVNPKRGMTFAVALRALLRQDPNKLMVGEIRDSETSDIAVKAAMTGHLVLSTLHTNDAASAISRLIDMGVDPFLVASSVILLSAQRLARKLCDHCKEPYDPLPPTEKLIQIGFKPTECHNLTIYRAVGCQHCRGGYTGRFAFLEALEIDDEIRKMILRRTPIYEIKEYAIAHKGMITLRRCGILNIIKGKTSIEEVLRMTEM